MRWKEGGGTGLRKWDGKKQNEVERIQIEIIKYYVNLKKRTKNAVAQDGREEKGICGEWMFRRRQQRKRNLEEEENKIRTRYRE